MKVASQSRQEKQALLESSSALRIAVYVGPLTSSSGLGGLVRENRTPVGVPEKGKAGFLEGLRTWPLLVT